MYAPKTITHNDGSTTRIYRSLNGKWSVERAANGGIILAERLSASQRKEYAFTTQYDYTHIDPGNIPQHLPRYVQHMIAEAHRFIDRPPSDRTQFSQVHRC